jgi:hypothetical protein
MDATTGSTAVITGTMILAALAYKITDVVKYGKALRGKTEKTRTEGWNGLSTLFWSAVLGVGAVWVMAQTEWGDEIKIGDETLGSLTGWSVVALGITITSFGSVLYDFKKAIDGNGGADTPALTKAAEDARQKEREASKSEAAQLAQRLLQ